MNRFHPAKPVSVYKKHWMFGRIRESDWQCSFHESLRKRLCKAFPETPIFSQVCDVTWKGVSAYLEITKTGEMKVHVEPTNLNKEDRLKRLKKHFDKGEIIFPGEGARIVGFR